VSAARGKDVPSGGGSSITTKLALGVTAAVSAVLIGGGAILYSLGVRATTEEIWESGIAAARNAARGTLGWDATGRAKVYEMGTQVIPVKYEVDGRSYAGTVYRHPVRRDGAGNPVEWAQVVVPQESLSRVRRTLFGLVAGLVVAGIAVAAIVTTVAVSRVTAPMRGLIEDVGAISRGRLDMHVHVAGGGEVGLLTRAVNRMIDSLREAQQAEQALQRREHDLEVAAGIREGLLPKKLPELAGFEIAAGMRPAEEIGGDAYDVFPLGEGKLGLLVAEVSGRGIQAGMLMTMARAYLRSAAEHASGLREALLEANRSLSRDVRRGMYVAALYAVVEAQGGRVRLASAGHKAPAIRYVAAEKVLRAIQPEGIALGFDPGPVFERTLREADFALEEGDRLVLTTSGALAVKDPEGKELGEKAFYALVHREAPKNSEAFVQLVLGAIERHAGGSPFASDVALVTVKRRKGEV
jgi:sigma-B regulation protein RsbU (phosphoserine phosphatase)